MTYNFILGASDPEMARIEELLRANNKPFSYATVDGKRVFPSTAYKGNGVDRKIDSVEVVTIECAVDGLKATIQIDHHRPGDPGFGLKPEQYLEASSIGQLLALLDLEATKKDRIIAAADHCLGHAYRGRCPGVEPEELLEARLREKAAFQRISYQEIRKTFDASVERFKTLPSIVMGDQIVVDTRKEAEPVPEANEVGAYLGYGVLYEMTDKATNQRKTGLIGGEPDAIRVFMEVISKLPNADGLYGDPERGFAGAYNVGNLRFDAVSPPNMSLYGRDNPSLTI